MNNDMRRFGVLAPPGNIALERELPPLLPSGVTSNHNRLSRPGAGINSDSLVKMAESIDRAAYDLAQAHPELILYGCTTGSFLHGIGREAETADKIAAVTGIPALTTSTAVVAALRAAGMRRVFMLTPYPDDINRHEVEFLAHYGIEVTGFDGFRCETSEAIRAVSSEQVAQLALRHSHKVAACDGLFISCTNLLTIDQIAGLEKKFDKPVVSSNQASLWAVLQAMGVDTGGIAAGRLFRLQGRMDVSRKAA